MTPTSHTFTGLELRPCVFLNGTTSAIQLGSGPVYIPADVFDQLGPATAAERHQLLAALQLVTIPARRLFDR